MSVNSLPAHKRANIRAFFQPWASLMVMGAKTFETVTSGVNFTKFHRVEIAGE